MPVTIHPAAHAGRAWDADKAATVTGLFEKSCPGDFKKNKQLMGGSITQEDVEKKHISPSQNGFVNACILAYSSHHHLIIRPEDTWFTILSQLSFYVTANADQLRHLFVSHEGKKTLEVKTDGTRYSVDLGAMAEEMTHLIHENVVDPDLREWIMPNFSTTTGTDRVVASVLMMGTLQKYFTYQFTFFCGIPSVTLQGVKEDWVELLHKIEKIPQFGPEAAEFAKLLRPILQHFVQSFDEPTSSAVRDFWSKITHRYSEGSGCDYMSGWITAFCFWSGYGRLTTRVRREGCLLDGISYPVIPSSSVPSGFASVPVKIDDNGHAFESKMVAGSIGIEAVSSGNMIEERYASQTGEHVRGIWTPDLRAPTGQPGLDTLQSVAGWFMYEVDPDEEAAAARDED